MLRSTLAFAAIAGIAAAQQGYGSPPPSYTSTTSAAAIPTGVPDAETCNCYLKLSDCQTAPNANQAFCASQFASCANYNPYGMGDATTAYFDNLQKYCHTSSSSAPPSYTTSAPPSYTTSATTIPTGVPDAETCNCYLKLSDCQTAPNANQAFCASQFSSCLGYSPYDGGDATTTFFDNLKKYCTTAPSSANAPPVYTPAPSSTSPPSALDCACYTKLGQCQSAPDVNESFCASQFASCTGSNPYSGTSAQVNAYFDNLKKNCPAGGATYSNAPPVYTPAPTSSNAPPVYTPAPTYSNAPPVYTPAPNGTHTSSPPAIYTGGAAKVAAPLVGAMAFGALFL